MNSKQPFLFSASLSLLCGILIVSCKSVEHEADHSKFGEKAEIKYQAQNTDRARQLFETLYSEYTLDFLSTPANPHDDEVLGSQMGYFVQPGTEEEYGPLVRYGRIWVYDAGTGLSLAAKENDPTADERALWLIRNGQYFPDPENPGETIFGGWAFSMNQAHLGDNWMDSRLVTGANTYALMGLAHYIASDSFLKLSPDRQREFSEFYADALEGILYHFEMDGPNEGLVTAGWSINALDDHAETEYTYYELLDLAGYEANTIDGYSKPVKRTRSTNVVTEHNNDLLKLLNLTLENYDRLFGFNNAPYSYQKLDSIRLKLRDSILGKLYDEQERRMITGRTATGVPSKFTAIDNASWLALSLNLEQLDSEQINALSDSLTYTIINFTADFEIDDATYFGAHYFPDGFEDPYIVQSTSYSSSFHIEATCGLICGLLEFAETYPDHPNSSFFREVATELWTDLQRYINDHGFIYASTSEGGTFEPKEASISAIWYLMTLKYFTENSDT